MEEVTLTREQVMGLLPRKEPLLLVDEITRLIPGDCAVGKWRVRPDLDVLRGHFPGDPTLPGIYTLEMSYQVSSILVSTVPEHAGKPCAFLGVDRSRYYKRVRPDDILTAHSSLVREDTERAQIVTLNEVYANDELAAEIEIVIGLRGVRPKEGGTELLLPEEWRALPEKRALSSTEILAFTRIRAPFRLVDEITELVPGKYAMGRLYVDPEIGALKGCSEEPMLPGTYLIEATGQLGGLSVASSPEFADKRSLLLGVNKARIYRNVRPGETLETCSRIAHIRRDKFIITFESAVFVAGELAAETEIAIAMR